MMSAAFLASNQLPFLPGILDVFADDEPTAVFVVGDGAPQDRSADGVGIFDHIGVVLPDDHEFCLADGYVMNDRVLAYPGYG